jgi:hypothetical protein
LLLKVSSKTIFKLKLISAESIQSDARVSLIL